MPMLLAWDDRGMIAARTEWLAAPRAFDLIAAISYCRLPNPGDPVVLARK